MNVLNALEDAKLHSRDVFMLYIDFSSAFDMVDHDKLLQLMWDMGFPLHAVQAVQGLYTGASTSIRAAFGTSDPIDIDRGTLQGDSLSPFLFLLFIEPLLRWLHVGGRGYKHGCTKDPAEQQKHACSAPAYADDLVAMTNSSRDLQVQAEKISMYLEWSGMEVNHKKCGATGVLYGSTASGRVTGAPLSKNAVQVLQRELRGRIAISGRAVPTMHPDAEPYRYLGVLLTPTLNWQHQRVALLESVIEKADGILRSPASDAQKLRMIDTLLRPHIRYSLCTGAYTSQDIACLDSMLARVAKFALRLPTSAPTALIQEDRDLGGVGVTSLQETYVAELTAKLVDALNVGGRSSEVTYLLLQEQVNRVGAALNSECASTAAATQQTAAHVDTAGRLQRHNYAVRQC